jgi:hypothetical protein
VVDAQQEARIREEMRQRIAEEDSRRRALEEERQQAEQLFQDEQARRRIMEEEARSYYQNSPDHFEYINESGDTEWLTRKQIQAREGYFDYEEHVEDLPGARRRVWMRMGAWLGLLPLLALFLVWYLWADEGSVTVLSNVPGAAIWVDGQATGQVADARLALSPGEHLLELRLPGYQADGAPFTVVNVVPRGRTDVQLRLRPAP